MFSNYHNILVLDAPKKPTIDKLLNFQGTVFSLKSFSEFPSTVLDFSKDKQKAVYDKVSSKVLKEAHHKYQGKSLSERLVFDENHTLWHFAKFRVYHSMIDSELLKTKIRLVPIEHQKSLLVISDRSVSNSELNSNEISFQRASVNSNSTKSGAGDLILLGVQFLKNALFNWTKFSILSKAKYVFLYDRSMIQLLSIDGESKGYFNPVLSFLESSKTVESAIILDFQLPKQISSSSLETQFRAKNAVWSEAILLKGMLAISPIRKTISCSGKLLNQLEQWKIEGGDAFIYSEIKSNWNYFRFHLFRFYCYQAIFSKSNKVAISRDENNPFARAFWQAGETKGLLSVGNQHGAIAEHSAAYLSNSKDHKLSSYPQLQFVWGEKWKAAITEKFELPGERMRTVGQLRTDVLKKIKDRHTDHKQFILYASQPIPNKSLLKQVDEIAFEAIKNSPNEQFVLKPHPKQIGKNLFHKFQELPNCSVEENEDLYELLAKSKATITAFSTVGAETVFFNNPLLTIDPLQQDIAGYSAEGIAQECFNSKELQFQIARLESHSLEMVGNFGEFISNNFFKVDGNVARRTWEEIDNQLDLLKRNKE